jgi:ribosomal protein S18 acetylase RimI-like enzyme
MSVERLQTHFEWNWFMYGLYDTERLVGYVSISKEADGAFEIHNLAVLPEYRHKGYGKQLLDFCKAKIKELGGSKINIGIIEENKVLKNWYAANGFAHIGTKRFDTMPVTVGYMVWEAKSPINIRFAVADDISDMIEVCSCSLEFAYKDFCSPEYIRKTKATYPDLFKRIITDENITHYIIQKNNKTVGAIVITPPQDDDIDDNYYEIGAIMLHPDYYEQGIRTRAIELIFDTVAAWEKQRWSYG